MMMKTLTAFLFHQMNKLFLFVDNLPYNASFRIPVNTWRRYFPGISAFKMNFKLLLFIKRGQRINIQQFGNLVFFRIKTKNYFDLFPFPFHFWRFQFVIPSFDQFLMHQVLFDVQVTWHRKISKVNYSICAKFRDLIERLAPERWLYIYFKRHKICSTLSLTQMTLNLNPLGTWTQY